jgi:hypothetical protein
MPKKVDHVEYEKRIRVVQEWIIDDWPYTDIVREIINKWGIQERQAKRYVADGRKRWVEGEQELLDRKRAMKLASLKKLKRSLKESYKGTPGGIRAIVAIEKEIIKLEGLSMPKQLSIGGIKDAPPIPMVTKITHNLVVKKCAK